MKQRKVPFEIIIAACFNLLLILLLYLLPGNSPPKPPISVEVDISDYTLPKPRIIPELKQDTKRKDDNKKSSEHAAASATTDKMQLEQNAIQDFSPTSMDNKQQPAQTIAQKRIALDNIQQDINFFKGLNKVKLAGQNGSNLPPGHRIGASFQSRLSQAGRAKRSRRYGGDKKSEGAVDKALAYLASHQNSNGSWGSTESFKTGDAAALSSLSLLAFLGHGETANSKLYGSTVDKGLNFLIQLANTPNIEYAGHGFGHAILTYALAEAYALRGSLTLKKIVETRIKTIIKRQNSFGSFNINYDNTPQAAPVNEDKNSPVNQEIIVGEPACDLSLLGWHIQALTAARTAGITVEGLEQALELSIEALVKIHQAKRGGFSQGINMKRFSANTNMNSVGLLGLQLLHAGSSSSARRVVKLLKAEPVPCWQQSAKFPLYRWYYATQALFQSYKGRGRSWDKWNENLKKELTTAQQIDGSWSPPGGDKSFQLKNSDDLTIYATTLCTLMLEVYYRYLPGYSIAEASNLNAAKVDKLDLGMRGLITRLPGKADPMAAVILGMGPITMKPLYFGRFNNIPATVNAPLSPTEFKQLASFASTIPVRSVKDWPQTLQSNQRIALFLDELLPENFKGNLQLSMAILCKATTLDKHIPLEIVINGKRLYYSKLPAAKNLVNVLIPSTSLEPFGNIIQIRNSGSNAVAFDAARLTAVNRPGKEIYLAAENIAKLPPDIQVCFNYGTIGINADSSLKQIHNKYIATRRTGAGVIFKIAKLPLPIFKCLAEKYAKKVLRWDLSTGDSKLRLEQISILKNINQGITITLNGTTAEGCNSSFVLPSFCEQRQTLPFATRLGEYSIDHIYSGSWNCIGSERMGNEFQKYYLRQTGREIIEWIASGGNGVELEKIIDGGKFYDSVFRTAYPAATALKQVAKLFDGKPHILPVGFYPRQGNTPFFATNVAGAYNAPGVATIIIARRFPLPIEISLNAIIPWNGATEMIIEKGFFSKKSPFNGFASSLERSSSRISINNNLFTYSGLLPEMTVIRLIRKDAVLPARPVRPAYYKRKPILFDTHLVTLLSPQSKKGKGTNKTNRMLRGASGFASIAGNSCSFQRIPSTKTEFYTPVEKQNIEVTFTMKKRKKRYDSVYLSLGRGADKKKYFSFNVYPRAVSSVKKHRISTVPLYFAFSGHAFKVSLPIGRWHRIRIALNDKLKAPDWSYLRIVRPERIIDRKTVSVSYEFDNIK